MGAGRIFVQARAETGFSRGSGVGGGGAGVKAHPQKF